MSNMDNETLAQLLQNLPVGKDTYMSLLAQQPMEDQDIAQAAAQGAPPPGSQTMQPSLDPLMEGIEQKNIPRLPEQEQPKQTRAQFFKQLLSDFLYSFATGMKESGTGPGANVRGAGAALLALPERERMMRGEKLEERRVSALESRQQAQEAYYTPSEEVLNPSTGERVKVAPKDLGAVLSGGYRLAGTLATVQGRKEEKGAKIASTEKIEGAKITAQEEVRQAQADLAAARASAVK